MDFLLLSRTLPRRTRRDTTIVLVAFIMHLCYAGGAIVAALVLAETVSVCAQGVAVPVAAKN